MCTVCYNFAYMPCAVHDLLCRCSLGRRFTTVYFFFFIFLSRLISYSKVVCLRTLALDDFDFVCWTCLNALFARIRNHILCATATHQITLGLEKDENTKKIRKNHQQNIEAATRRWKWYIIFDTNFLLCWLWKFLFAHRERMCACEWFASVAFVYTFRKPTRNTPRSLNKSSKWILFLIFFHVILIVLYSLISQWLQCGEWFACECVWSEHWLYQWFGVQHFC